MNKIKSTLMIMALIAAASLAGCLTGCAPYQSKVVVGSVSLSLPKDASFDALQAIIPTTNGNASITITKGVFKMNPAVIDSKTAHDVAIINSTAQAVGAIAGAVAK